MSDPDVIRAAFAEDAGTEDLTRFETPGHPDPRPAGRPAGERADQALIVERPDLGPGRYTQISTGHLIPDRLADFPRRPAAGAQSQRTARKRARRGTEPHTDADPRPRAR